MINNRQAGRRRGRGGNGQGGGQGGGNGPRHGGGQRDNGNRIDSRARGNANQLYEKYKNLASDAQRQGDRVNTEYYLQFADHYFRVLSETRNRFEEQQQRNRPDERFEAQPFTGSFDSGFDGQEDEFADEGEPIRPGEQSGREQAMGANEREDRGDRAERDGARRDERSDGQGFRREGRPPRDGARRDEEGERAPREQVARDQQPRDAEQPRYQGSREDGPRRGPREARREEHAPLESNGDATPAHAPVDAVVEGEAPRRRGRPRRERPADEAPAAFDASLLPPSLGIAPAAVAVEAAAEEKPRRRRVRAAAVEAPAAE